MFSSALLCLALTIYMEARGEPEKGQIAVAIVTLERVKDKDMPDSVCEVVTQKGQYTWNKNVNIKNADAFEKSKRLARDILNNKIKLDIGHRLYFNHYALGKKWDTPYKPLRIGDHIFY